MFRASTLTEFHSSFSPRHSDTIVMAMASQGINLAQLLLINFTASKNPKYAA